MRKRSGGESINISEVAEKLNITTTDYHFRKPNKEDGASAWELVKHTGNLDLNSSYSYIMWCEIFSDTSIVVVRKETQKVIGFISGFIHPDQPDTLFIWQVAVHSSERGNGLATKMLLQLLDRDACEGVHYVEATVSPSNSPSKRLFLGLARKFETNWKISDYITTDDFPGTGHEDEMLFKIGPLEK
ncbi:diaminobutyrate acetyltransferase [Virgibacillus profundi]|uniref:L-2,4-diaminobutyric acid acetyltransferase n=1 Tax=Virgibacillus profundi TaxID=2024555 RepID=A0A2A2IA22_9BACI|nr:diaminobutyrate acetyltransferase [Virgibacillus profundi]PAV27970.1 diaminobutyrate acetyltransferase [Virgibacillus profundi]PXY52148.1 diaminobutyrate acetyltransferase [Virgibacillus profundi]